MAATGRVARVLIDSALPQLDHLFDYRIPEELLGDAIPGVRVKVPLRSAGRIADGYLIDFPDAEYEGALSDVDAVVSPVPVLSPEVWALARRVADRSAGTANDVVRLAVPGRQVRVEKAWLAARAAEAAGGAPDPAPFAASPVRGYEPGRVESAVAGEQRIALQARPHLSELPDGTWVGEWAVTLASAAAGCWASGRSAIVVVPDYRDQDQLAAALAAIAPREAVVRADARQSNAERYRAFLDALASPRIVIGNRSAVYAPATELGLIAVWDDGDPLHAEPLSPYVHARDAALVRQELQGGALIFAGHSRSAEVQRLVEVGWLLDVAPERAISPKVLPTANQAANDAAARSARIPSTAWQTAKASLESGPVLVQVARPGYAPVLACANCGQAARCNRCEGPLGQTRSGATPSCGWCGALATDWHCDNCEHTRFRMVTVGAGRTAEELGRAFPGVRVVVADGEHPLQTIGASPALVVATRGAEPIAAGGYRAILLLDGERMLARETLRVAEDCMRWWSNAAALAAPGAPTVLVGVGGRLARDLATWRQVDFAHQELADRRALRFPPAVRLASLTGSAEVVDEAVAEVDPAILIDVLGPVPLADGAARTILRFDYAHGPEVASAVRAAIVRNATRRRRAPAGKGGFRPAPSLKVRFDDPELA
ncbi:primosomal protein N' [Diaminobutyricibacter tongyongensis]|uniref:Probable replication restart protein PriA n=1 Tax=Leifsonia tongyongensis TaxID=1268043 RepID=A0A6L9XYK2_9MICO|nr:primosomal protein N' [Diaminobutyricibacter tongyongensis]